MVYRKAVKLGNGIAVILPARWARDLGINIGDYILIGLTESDVLVLRKADPDFVLHKINPSIQHEN